MKAIVQARPQATDQVRLAFRAPSWLVPASVALAILGVVTAVLGPLVDRMYAQETENWTAQAIGQDLVNLLAFPVLLGVAVLARRGSIGAFLAWTGTLAYAAYTFAIYAFTIHFGPLFLAYVAILGGSAYALGAALLAIASGRIVAPMTPTPRAAGTLLIAIGGLFSVLWLSEIIPANLANRTPDALADAGLVTSPVHVLDLALLLPASIATGLGARRGHAWAALVTPVLLVTFLWLSLGILAAMATLLVRGNEVAAAPAILVGALTVLEGVTLARLLRASRMR